MKHIYDIKTLSECFQKDYPLDLYPEIEFKSNRPYLVLLISIENTQFAIPLRSNIKHKNCYHFRRSNRKKHASSGIDFSKAIVVKKASYLGKIKNIDNSEYIEIKSRIFFIIKQFKKYLFEYIDFINNGSHEPSVERKFKYTTLKYFRDDLLGMIDNSKNK